MLLVSSFFLTIFRHEKFVCKAASFCCNYNFPCDACATDFFHLQIHLLGMDFACATGYSCGSILHLPQLFSNNNAVDEDDADAKCHPEPNW